MSIRLWEPATGTTSGTTLSRKDIWRWITALAFSPDGKKIVTAVSNDTLELWDLARGWTSITIGSELGWVKALTFSPNGKQIVSASGNGTTGYVFEWIAEATPKETSRISKYVAKLFK